METGAAKAACRIGSKLAAGRIRVLYKITTAEGLRILKGRVREYGGMLGHAGLTEDSHQSIFNTKRLD